MKPCQLDQRFRRLSPRITKEEFPRPNQFIELPGQLPLQWVRKEITAMSQGFDLR